jgi:predicted Fe-Mo cluster-binding NifX family protein
LKTTIIIPVEDESGLNARIAEHFGRAPFYAVVTLGKNGEVDNVKAVSNSGEHFGGQGHMHDNLLKLKPSAVITFGMGPRGIIGFTETGTKVLKATGETVKDVVSAFKNGELEEITESCHHAHHH